MNYKVDIEISGGESHGFGIKYPCHVNKEIEIDANDNISALTQAAKIAYEFSRDSLSNPDDDYTTVTLNNLYGPDGVLNIKDVLKDEGLEGVKFFTWEDGKLVTKCSSLEHLMSLMKNGTND